MSAEMTAAFYCYIVECADGSFYTGWTTNPQRRIQAHNAGRGSRYTRARRPVRLVMVEPQEDRRRAMRRERVIKSMTRLRKMELISSRLTDADEGRTPAYRPRRQAALKIAEVTL